MFTGLIEDVGIVDSISLSQIRITTKLDEIAKGDSVSVNGVCLTIVTANKGDFVADYSPNTGAVTTLSKLKQNSRVNLERALKLSSRLGGHIVSGHVDCTAKIEKMEKLKKFYRIIFACGRDAPLYCVDKGSIAIDGISLTVSDLSNSKFEIFVIPETFNNTIVQFWKIGSEVNVESDILAKYVKKFTDKKITGISMEMLKGNGFI
ncbi:MAG: riboflavin synthase [Endomicrobium sp.]|jgi:riboflavin synthase|nr:riboflavin synthase [Endomicrobium sp.]